MGEGCTFARVIGRYFDESNAELAGADTGPSRGAHVVIVVLDDVRSPSWLPLGSDIATPPFDAWRPTSAGF